MVSPNVSMSLPSSDLGTYHYSGPSLMPIPWIPPGGSPTQSPFKVFTPQVAHYSPPKLAGAPILHGMEPSPSVNAGANVAQGGKRKNAKKVGSKPSYKHVPHKDKPPHLVARRNARERRRVQAVNSAFAKLRKCLPIENRSKRLSKVKTLHRAIDYINNLQAMLRQTDGPEEPGIERVSYARHRSEGVTSPDDDDDDLDEDRDVVDDDREDSELHEFDEYLESDVDVVNKENEGHHTWTTLSSGGEPNYWTYVSSYNEDYSAGYAN